jgi:hypothetical protein
MSIREPNNVIEYYPVFNKKPCRLVLLGSRFIDILVGDDTVFYIPGYNNNITNYNNTMKKESVKTKQDLSYLQIIPIDTGCFDLSIIDELYNRKLSISWLINFNLPTEFKNSITSLDSSEFIDDAKDIMDNLYISIFNLGGALMSNTYSFNKEEYINIIRTLVDYWQILRREIHVIASLDDVNKLTVNVEQTNDELFNNRVRHLRVLK